MTTMLTCKAPDGRVTLSAETVPVQLPHCAEGLCPAGGRVIALRQEGGLLYAEVAGLPRLVAERLATATVWPEIRGGQLVRLHIEAPGLPPVRRLEDLAVLYQEGETMSDNDSPLARAQAEYGEANRELIAAAAAAGGLMQTDPELRGRVVTAEFALKREERRSKRELRGQLNALAMAVDREIKATMLRDGGDYTEALRVMRADGNEVLKAYDDLLEASR